MKGLIKAIAKEPKTYNGVTTLGFMINDIWHNIKGDEQIFEEARKMFLSKGNEIEFTLEEGYAVEFKLLKKSEEPEEKKWEDDIVSFETLLTKAHGLKKDFSIKTEMLQLDLEKKFALFKATVIVEVDSEHDMVFEGHGDVTSDNVKGDFIKPHFIRFAETRAICRALRWYTNNACAEEEK